MRRTSQGGQSTVEYAILTASITIPMVFGLIFVAEMMWVWHSVVELTRDGARYAATHCWSNGDNVVSYMRSHIPLMVDQEQFQTGSASLLVNYYSRDPGTGALVAFSCDTDCSTSCVPDVVTVQVANYQFQGLAGYLKLQPVAIPSFLTSVPMEGAGCDPEQGTCTP